MSKDLIAKPKFIVAIRRTGQIFEFPSKNKADGFIKDLKKKDKNIEYATAQDVGVGYKGLKFHR